MLLETLYYRDSGWSSAFPNLDSENTLILVFSAPEFIDSPEPIKELAERYPHSKIVGCSSSGEICNQTILDKSITVAIAKFEKTKIRIMRTEIEKSENSKTAGLHIAQMLNGPNLCGIFILSDGLNVNGSELVKGLNTIGKGNVVITGGLAGDGSRFNQTWAIYNGEIYKNNIIGVGFYGDHIKIGHGSRAGWDIFGPERRITRSKNNILYELDGKPALSLYKEYLGDKANNLPAMGLLYPLAIRKNASDPTQLVRTILAVDEKTQSLRFAGDMPKGYLAKLMHANFDRLIIAADEAGELAAEKVIDLAKHHKPILAIAISCVGRRLLLGERTEEETEATLSSLPQGTKQIGFYSYGELSPYSTGACELHNQTMTLTTLCEE